MSNRPSTLEDLSDDILMDIFDCLNPPIYIYHSFDNLNHRFNRILRDSRLLISLDLSSVINPSNFAYHCQVMLPSMFSQLISLRLSNEQKLFSPIEIFLQNFHLTKFRVLRQLSLIEISFDQLRRMLAEILALEKLIRLEIDMFDGSGVTSNELSLLANTLISRSSSIQFVHLRFNRELIITEQFSPSIRHFSLDCCSSSDVFPLLTLSNDLQSLKLKVESSHRRFPLTNLLESNEEISRERFSSYLTSFSLEINDLTFVDVRKFLSQMPFLREFRLQGLSYDLNFSRGNLWQTMIERETSKLKEFHINGLRIWLGNHADSGGEYFQLIPQVTLSFNPSQDYWQNQWKIEQSHKLRPNHLNLTIHAKSI